MAIFVGSLRCPYIRSASPRTSCGSWFAVVRISRCAISVSPADGVVVQAAEQYAAEQAAEARAANKAKKAALQARDSAQEEVARHLAEVNKLKRRVSAAEEVSQVGSNGFFVQGV